ncbi:MAG: flavodoxin family protein [Candidatus Thermoplasmatota archaeon]|jgi:flavodoxin|nr:flavodoxin family protein [Candidatus Thermoplasmatota archaeon]
MKIGIIYYSRTGNTKKAAQLLEEKFKQENADIELLEIEHVKKPGFFTAGRSALKQVELPIKNTDFDLKNYDFIIIGSPTWAGYPSPFVKTFMSKAENVKGKNAAVFGTGISPINSREKFRETIENNLKNLGVKTVDNFLGLRMKKGEILDGKQNIDGFVKGILNK